MATKSLHANTLVTQHIASAAKTNGAANGTAIDCGVYGNNFRDVLIVFQTAAITDGTHAVTVEESDLSGSGYAAVESWRVSGSLPSLSSSDDNVVAAIGVRPSKRYVRAVLTTSGATTGGVIGAVAIAGSGSDNPVKRS